jgi:hypothetical protein
MSSNKRLAVFAGAGGLLLVAAAPASAAIDLAALQVSPQRGQSAEQTRRDRYECHNWAVDESGVVPQALPAGDRQDGGRGRRAERIGRVLNGAAIGAGIGGLIRAVQDKDPSNGVLAGAAAGAAVGAATADRDARESRTIADEGDTEYLRALSACLEGRGYLVALPGADESVAQTAPAK